MLLLAALSEVHSFDIKSIAIAGPRLIPGYPGSIDYARLPKQKVVKETSTASKALPAVTSFEEAIRIIDECAVDEKPAEQLYEAVRFVERNAYKLYPDMADKQALWDRAQGCFKLVLSTGDAKTRAFHTPSYMFPFSFAMIQGEYFGNGFGLNENMILISVLQKHYLNMKIRQMVVTVKDIYFGGNQSTDIVPDFIKKAINVGKTPEDFAAESKRPPAFTIVAATEHALVARGNQSGGLAIWHRFKKDILPVAYKDVLKKET
eukprot:scaffold9441_cov167-Amphora_coffeaeformis.AAC.11